MAQVTSYQRGSFTFTGANQSAATAQTCFTNSSAAPMRVINAGCVGWNYSGNEVAVAVGFFLRHNGSTSNVTTAMLQMVRSANGIGGVEFPPSIASSSRGGAIFPASTTRVGPDSLAFGTSGSADPLGASAGTGIWYTSGAWWMLDDGGRTFNNATAANFGSLVHMPGGFWMSPGDVLVCKAYYGSASAASGNSFFVAYNFITVTDSGS